MDDTQEQVETEITPRKPGDVSRELKGQVSRSSTSPLPARRESGNQELEAALQKALDADDLGELCKTLGEAFCLPTRSPRAEGYDSESDTTAPADQDQSSSESGTGSETGGEGGTSVSRPASCTGASDGTEAARKRSEGNVAAVASAAEVMLLSKMVLFQRVSTI